ncbi:histidine kinase [Rhodoferax sp. AJA081-3]|nr:histidine kinase [Rhodoferax sp. AJA081-3]
MLQLRTAQATLTLGEQTQSVDVQLPYGWDFHHKGQAGVGRFVMAFEGPITVPSPWALYFHRLGNAYQVKLNGVVLDANGSISEATGSDYAKVPRFVRIPAGVLLPHNQLEVTIRSESGRRSGVPAVWVGPKDELEPLYQREYAIRVGGSGVFTVFSLVVGVFAFVLWVSQTDPRPERRGVRDRLYLFAALAEFAWAFFIGDTLIERPPLPWAWWSVTINTALAVWLSALLMFCHTIAGWAGRPASQWVQAILGGLLLAGPLVAYFAISLHKPLLLTLWQAAFALIFVPSSLLFVTQALRKGRGGMQRMVALAFVINVPVGVHDFYVMRIGEAFGNQAYLRYTATLFGLALGAIAIERFRSANLRVRDMLDSLAVRVLDKEQELSRTYQRMEAIAREQERVQERARILRDMHDGVGSHITSAIRQLRSGHANPDEILLTLQDSLDQLKLSIDALNLPPGDVTALLANLRYRLEPRFKAMGLSLEWATVPLPTVPRLDASAMRQLQYILFEALSNAMQHAQASVLRIEATPALHSAGGVSIRVCDNGLGFDTRTVTRKGLASMEDRAIAIGAQLHISSQAGKTEVEILLG